MDEKNTYNVVISNSADDTTEKTIVAQKLATLFKTSEDKARQLLSKPEVTIKKDLDKATAEKYHAAISKTGANCRIINTAADDVLPDIIEPVKPDTEGLIRQAPQPAQTHSTQDTELKILDKEQQDEKTTREKLSAFENANAAAHCPECGTIRSSGDAVCLHCGYDPASIKKDRSGLKKTISYAAVILIVLAIAMFAGQPFYQQYAQQQKIKNGLQLAIDTRNTITQFILKTNFWPNQNIDAGLAEHISNDVIASIKITGNGAFTVTLHEHVLNMSGQTLIFTPQSLQGKLVWNCTRGTLANDYRPDICKLSE